jgi:hypothetical protein
MTTRELVSTILLFCEEINGVEFYAYQRRLAYRIIESLLLNDGATITALFSRQSGKSETLASTALGVCVLLPVLAALFPADERLQSFAKGVLIGIYAPKLELSGPIYLKVRDRAHSERATAILADPEINVSIVQSRGDSLALSNGSVINASTASESTMVEGKTHHLVLIDEAQRVSGAKVRKEIAPMLAATNGSMVKIGTAWMSKGGFHNDIQYNVEEERKGNKQNHFQFDYEQVITEKRALYNRQKREHEEGRRETPADRFHLMYEKWLQGELAKLGGNKDAEEFKMNFRLLWQESRTIAIKEVTFRAGQLPGSEANVPKHHGIQYAGLDVAKENDSTVLTIIEVDRTNPISDPSARNLRDKDGNPVLFYNKYILAWLELQGSFEHVQYGALVEFLREFSVQSMFVDATGMGDPVCERLQVLLAHIDVEPFKYGSGSKSDLYKYALQEWDANRIWYPTGEHTIRSLEYQHFEQQHLDLERWYNGSYLVCAAPEGEGYHDDYPDSLCLALHAAKQAPALPMVEVEDASQLYGGRSTQRMAWGAAGNARAARYAGSRRGSR